MSLPAEGRAFIVIVRDSRQLDSQRPRPVENGYHLAPAYLLAITRFGSRPWTGTSPASDVALLKRRGGVGVDAVRPSVRGARTRQVVPGDCVPDRVAVDATSEGAWTERVVVAPALTRLPVTCDFCKLNGDRGAGHGSSASDPTPATVLAFGFRARGATADAGGRLIQRVNPGSALCTAGGRRPACCGDIGHAPGAVRSWATGSTAALRATLRAGRCSASLRTFRPAWRTRNRRATPPGRAGATGLRLPST